MPNKDNKIPIDLKNEENQFYKSDKFRIDLDEGKHLRGILVKIYPDRGSINTIYREQGNDLRALLDGSMTPDVLWLDVLDNLSLFNKLEAFIEYLYEKDINENMNTILLSIDPNLTRKKPESPIPPGENHDPEREKKEKCLKLCKKLLRWFFYINIVNIIM